VSEEKTKKDPETGFRRHLRESNDPDMWEGRLAFGRKEKKKSRINVPLGKERGERSLSSDAQRIRDGSK